MSSSIDIVVPVYNEEQALPDSIGRLTKFLDRHVLNPWQVIIADNASVDRTREVSEALCQRDPRVKYRYLPQKGRGRALRTAWLESAADLVSYMDVDLSTDLVHLPQLIEALESGYHVAIGCRLSQESQITRSLKRELISRGYNLVIRSLFFTAFSDAQCGFKALRREAAEAIVPAIKNNNWFFDTELLIIAAKGGYRIKSVPVKWYEDPNSTVNIVNTAAEDISGLLRLRFGGIPPVAPPNDTSARPVSDL